MAKAKTSTQESTESVDKLSTLLIEGDTTNRPLIYGAMLAIMRDMDAIVKKKQSGGVSYAFRSIDDVMNALHPLLVEHGVFIVPILRRLDNRVFEQDKLDNQGNKNGTRNQFQSIVESAYRFTAADGSFVEAVVGSESTDYSDKATQQALSYCFKIAVLQTFCVPTKDVVTDGDERTPTVDGKQAQARDTKQSAPSATVEKMTTDAWNTLKKELAPFNLDDRKFHNWVVMTLRAQGLAVPAKMDDLPKADGRKLFPIAQESAKANILLDRMPEENEDLSARKPMPI